MYHVLSRWMFVASLCGDIAVRSRDCLQAMKTYHQYHGESIQAENKLRYVESQKLKAEQGSRAGQVSRKARSMEKQADKVRMHCAMSLNL